MLTFSTLLLCGLLPARLQLLGRKKKTFGLKMLLLLLLFQGLYQSIEAFGIAGDRPRGLLLPSNVFAAPLPRSRNFFTFRHIKKPMLVAN